MRNFRARKPERNFFKRKTKCKADRNKNGVDRPARLPPRVLALFTVLL